MSGRFSYIHVSYTCSCYDAGKSYFLFKTSLGDFLFFCLFCTQTTQTMLSSALEVVPSFAQKLLPNRSNGNISTNNLFTSVPFSQYSSFTLPFLLRVPLEPHNSVFLNKIPFFLAHEKHRAPPCFSFQSQRQCEKHIWFLVQSMQNYSIPS